MSRLRRLDRAILSEGTDTTPLDSDDQEQLIAHFTEQNDTSLRLFLKVLIGSILLEIPISILFMKRASGMARPMVLLLVCHVLTLINCLYDFRQPKAASSVGIDNHQNGSFSLQKLRSISKYLFSFYGVFLLNTIVLLQLLYQVYSSHGFRPIDTLLVLPVINLIGVGLIRKWYSDVSKEIRDLHNLKYKFKTA